VAHSNPMIRKISIAAVAIALIGLVGFCILAWRAAIAPLERRPDPASFRAEDIARGEILSAEGHCVSCHIQPGGQRLAGGYGVNTPFGVIYGTNITPDTQTGIGRWSLPAFTRAMREGVSRDGPHLYAAFPYTAFTELSDDDINALYAYLMTRTPVSATIPSNTVPFPLNIRLLQEGWKVLFFKKKVFQTNPGKNSEWNRGAYLSEAVSDCGGCHTPRNALGAEEFQHAYAGTVIDHWIAPPLTTANPSPVSWTQEELFDYLRTGVGRLHGAALDATMTPVVRNALDASVVPDADVRALATYFSDINHAGVGVSNVEATVAEVMKTSAPRREEEYDADANLYAGACMSCHYNSGTTPLAARPELALSSSLSLNEPTNFIQTVLRGVGSNEGAPGLVMPAYASSLSDADVARLAAYLRRTRTTLPPWRDLEKKAASIRGQLAKSR
jgi:mono/diheme cytochrome c family protein